MKQAKIGHLKNQLSRYLDYVRAGGEVLVLDRDKPVARIVPLRREAAAAGGEEARLRRLEGRGLIRRATGRPPSWLGRSAPVGVPGGLLRELRAEREESW